MNDTRSPVPQRRATGAALIASGGIYFTAEFIAAAAWTDPPYSYTYHFISDLGVHGPSTGFGQYMYSPLAWVMNAGFILFGIAAFAGVVMLGGLPGRRRWAAIVLAALLAAGVTRQPPPQHGHANLTGKMGTTHGGVRVIDVGNAAPECVLLQHRTGGLDLWKVRHPVPSVRTRCPAGPVVDE